MKFPVFGTTLAKLDFDGKHLAKEISKPEIFIGKDEGMFMVSIIHTLRIKLVAGQTSASYSSSTTMAAVLCSLFVFC